MFEKQKKQSQETRESKNSTNEERKMKLAEKEPRCSVCGKSFSELNPFPVRWPSRQGSLEN